MLDKLTALIAPFSAIAHELRILRELYELELQSRQPPIIRVTESAAESDTEITYSSDPPPKIRSALHRLLAGEQVDDDEEA